MDMGGWVEEESPSRLLRVGCSGLDQDGYLTHEKCILPLSELFLQELVEPKQTNSCQVH